jgi:putative endonuclease
MSYSVYILYSESTERFYKGQTNDLQERLRRHNMLREKATRSGAPWKLMAEIKVSTRSEAVILERKLKNLSRKRLIEFIKKHSEEVAGPDNAG